MSERNNQESCSRFHNQTECPSRGELQVPVNYVDRILGLEQDDENTNYSTTEFLFAMLDCLTDYILELVGSEFNNSNTMDNTLQGQSGKSNSNRRASRNLENVPFAPFDEIPGSRKSG
ncbi:huntingtin-interacting protein M [Ochotona princeps]|uniref:huntingtin-interacting protein M n=1 Tax=Ochotona princeps TaxID=9978 RepID=UPI00032ADC61|nr:huntingtin-interacting protein M [Ochotona princeps]